MLSALARDFREIRFDTNGLIGMLVAIVVVAFFVHFAARIVLERGGFMQAIATTILGFLLATLVMVLVTGTLGLVLGLAVWALVAALIYRTAWIRGAVIGLVAFVLWILVQWLIGLLLAS